MTIPNTFGITLRGAGQGLTIVQGTTTSTHTLFANVKAGNALTRITDMIAFDAKEVKKVGIGADGLVWAAQDSMSFVSTMLQGTINISANGRGIIVYNANGEELGGLH